MKLKNLITATVAFSVLVVFIPPAALSQKVEEQKPGKQKGLPVYLPDLAVTSMEVLNSDTGKFKVTVMNKGKGTAEWAELRLTIWNLNDKVYVVYGTSQPALGPNEKQPVIFEVGMPVSSMKYELFTDYTKKVGESNELNNILKGYIGKY